MRTFFKAHGHKFFILLFWLLIAGGVWFYARQSQLSPLKIVQEIIGLASQSVWGPLIYVMAYTIRPLTLLPSVLLSVAGGYLFGPYFGTLYAIIGSNGSANVGYVIAFLLGQGFFKTDSNFLTKYADRMRQNSFEAVLTMRLLFLPYDTVSLVAGFLRINWGQFALATLLGGAAGTLSFALFGASIEGEFIGATPTFEPWTMLLAGGIFVLSLLLSRLIRRRQIVESVIQN